MFGPTDSAIFGSYHDFNLHEVIQVDGSIVNNVLKKQRGQERMLLISVDKVFDKAYESLNV